MKKITLLLLLFSFAVHGQVITTAVGTGTAGYSGNNGPATNAKLNYPSYICSTLHGELLISDYQNDVIRKVNASGVITTIAGNGASGYSGDGGDATAAKISGPTGIVTDDGGNIYFCEAINHVIRKISVTGTISTFAGKGTSGYSGDGGQATNAELNKPYGIAIDKFGSVYFVDNFNYRVRKIDPSGIISTIAGNGTAGYSGDGGPATDAQFKYFGGIAINNSSGDIYVTDYATHCIRKINKSGIISTFAGTGLMGNSGDGGLATNAQLNGPNGVHVDESGNVYITDNYANVIRKVNPFGIISTIAGNGTAGYSGDGGPATNAQLSNPNDIAINSSGNILICETDNNVVRKIAYKKENVTNINSIAEYINIYPNPANEELIIESLLNANMDELVILNVLGKSVFQEKCFKNKTSINISSYAPGIYFVRVNGSYAGMFMKE